MNLFELTLQIVQQTHPTARQRSAPKRESRLASNSSSLALV